MSANGFEPEYAARCPVCQARFRGASICSRCGADLMLLMLLRAQAYSHRQAARQSLRVGDVGNALAAAKAAQELHPTKQGGILEMVCAVAKETARSLSVARSPSIEKARHRAWGEMEGTSRAVRAQQETLPSPTIARRQWKSLCLLATAALVGVTALIGWVRHRQPTEL